MLVVLIVKRMNLAVTGSNSSTLRRGWTGSRSSAEKDDTPTTQQSSTNARRRGIESINARCVPRDQALPGVTYVLTAPAPEWFFTHHGARIPSHQDIRQYLAMDVGQSPLDPIVIIAQPLVIDAEEMENGRVQIVDRCDVLHRLIAEVVRRAVAEAFLHPRACEPDSEAVRIMVTPIGAFLEGRHASEFSDPDDQRLAK